MLSLNEGVELDNELIDANQEAGKELDQLLFADIVPGEVPQLAQQTDVEALVTKLRALDYAQNNLETIGGINQQFVLESQHLVPGLVTDQVLLGFYTQDITKTRYNFAMEAIAEERKSVGQHVRETFAKLVAWVKEQFNKLLEWMKAKLASRLPLGEKPPADHDVSEKHWKARYAKAFGQDIGMKVYEDMKPTIDLFDKKLTSMKVKIGQNFYFANMHKGTPDFKKFLNGLVVYNKKVDKVGEEFQNYVSKGKVWGDEEKSACLARMQEATSDVAEFVRFLDEFVPAPEEINRNTLLTDGEVAVLLFDNMRGEYNTLNSHFAEAGSEISVSARALDTVLQAAAKKIEADDDYVYTAVDNEIIRLISSYRTYTSKVFSTMNNCADSIRGILGEYGDHLDSHSFASREEMVCQRHNVDVAKLRA